MHEQRPSLLIPLPSSAGVTVPKPRTTARVLGISSCTLLVLGTVVGALSGGYGGVEEILGKKRPYGAASLIWRDVDTASESPEESSEWESSAWESSEWESACDSTVLIIR